MPRVADGLPALPDSFWPTIDGGLREIGLEISAGVRAALDAHARLLITWNAAINLTAMRSPDQIARGHILDSLLAVPALRSLTADRERPSVLDVGSGAGYPGLPVALALPARRVALVDSIGKKAAFLDIAAQAVASEMHAAGEDAPEFDALAERAEALSVEQDHRAAWDMVVARAVGSVAEVAELGLPLVRRHGHVVAWKLEADDGALSVDMDGARSVVYAAGGGRARVVHLAAAARLGLGGHCLVVIRKEKATPDRFPRPVGERRRAALR